MKDYSFLKAQLNYAHRFQDIQPHPSKNEFERDRDRILYSRIFRRLDKKTQVFVSGFDDNVRTRLTHSLEVSHIAKRISGKFGFDLDLTEAIALGHDTGHTPFGHVGERTLNYFMNGCIECNGYENLCSDGNRGFKHNLQGYKSLNELEAHRVDEKALNLTSYTLWGIVNHTKLNYEKECDYYNNGICLRNNKECKLSGKLKVDYYDKYLSNLSDTDWTFEGIVVAMADEIAQLHHDFEDGVCGKLITANRLIKNYKRMIKSDLFESLKEDTDPLCILSTFCSGSIEELIDIYVDSLSKKIDEIINLFGIVNNVDFESKKGMISKYLKENNQTICGYFNSIIFERELDILKGWISHIIINSELTQTMNGKAEFIITRLFKAYIRNPQQLPDKTIIKINDDCLKLKDKKGLKSLEKYVSPEKEGVARENLVKILKDNDDKTKTIIMRIVCDYIAGMTDDYAISQYNKLYGFNNLQSDYRES